MQPAFNHLLAFPLVDLHLPLLSSAHQSSWLGLRTVLKPHGADDRHCCSSANQLPPATRGGQAIKKNLSPPPSPQAKTIILLDLLSLSFGKSVPSASFLQSLNTSLRKTSFLSHLDPASLIAPPSASLQKPWTLSPSTKLSTLLSHLDARAYPASASSPSPNPAASPPCTSSTP